MVGEYLKEAREKAEKSIYDVEKELGINHSQLYRWEKNVVEPSIINCIKLAEYYGISLDDLVGREYGHYDDSKIKYYKCNINAKDNNNF